MLSVRLSRPSAQVAAPAAALLRFVALVLAAASTVIIPSALAAAAQQQATPTHAFALTGVAACLTLLVALVARGLDPQRG